MKKESSQACNHCARGAEPTMSEAAAAAAAEPSILSGRTLNIEDLNEVITLLERHHYNKATYHDLGLRLKSSYNTLERIKKDHKDVNPCFRECLVEWLRKVDGVQNPTIDALIAALRGIGENAVADGITRERKSLVGLSKGSEGSATDQMGHYDESTPSDAAEATELTDQNDQSTPSSLSADATPTGKKNNPPKQSNKKKGFSLFSRKKNQRTQISSDTDVAARDILLEDNFRRSKKGFWLFKDTFEQEKVCIQRQGDSIYLVTGKKDKEMFDMKTCIGVYSRLNLDHASKKWPGDAEPECCFTVHMHIVDDEDDSDSGYTIDLYLIANNPDIAEKWVKELKRHVHLKKGDRRKGYFGFYDLQEVYDTLTEDESTTWNIDLLATSLGLSEDTQKMIKECFSTEKDRLRECLYHWLKGVDGDGDTEVEGPKCDELKEVLKHIGKEEIAKKIEEKFSPTVDFADSVRHAKNEDARQKAWARSGKIDQHDQAVATAKKVSCGKMLLDAVTYKMQQNDVGSVLAEICFLSNTMRSSLVTIDNKTSTEIIYHKCFIARGREARYVGFDRSIAPKSKTSYSFEKYTTLSLEGCAAMICFSATTYEPNPTKCFFVVAFRNRLMISNKTALLILDSLESVKELSDSKDYGDIMRNKKDNPVKLKYACKDDKYRSTFMWVGCGNMAELKFPFIDFHLYMNNDYYHSHSTITVSHPETNA